MSARVIVDGVACPVKFTVFSDGSTSYNFGVHKTPLNNI